MINKTFIFNLIFSYNLFSFLFLLAILKAKLTRLIFKKISTFVKLYNWLLKLDCLILMECQSIWGYFMHR